jgi:hypothetical protein
MKKQGLDNKHDINTEDHVTAQPAPSHSYNTKKIKLYGQSKTASDQPPRNVNMPE